MQNNVWFNPSYYEGWSTINEEARSKLKYIFLSNIKGTKNKIIMVQFILI